MAIAYFSVIRRGRKISPSLLWRCWKEVCKIYIRLFTNICRQSRFSVYFFALTKGTWCFPPSPPQTYLIIFVSTALASRLFATIGKTKAVSVNSGSNRTFSCSRLSNDGSVYDGFGWVRHTGLMIFEKSPSQFSYLFNDLVGNECT